MIVGGGHPNSTVNLHILHSASTFYTPHPHSTLPRLPTFPPKTLSHAHFRPEIKIGTSANNFLYLIFSYRFLFIAPKFGQVTELINIIILSIFSAWLTEADGEVVDRMNKRVHLMTNLDLETAEQLQAKN